MDAARTRLNQGLQSVARCRVLMTLGCSVLNGITVSDTHPTARLTAKGTSDLGTEAYFSVLVAGSPLLRLVSLRASREYRGSPEYRRFGQLYITPIRQKLHNQQAFT